MHRLELCQAIIVRALNETVEFFSCTAYTLQISNYILYNFALINSFKVIFVIREKVYLQNGENLRVAR